MPFFFSEYAENQKNVIMIQDFPDDVIEAFITYLNTGNMTTDVLNVEMLKFTHQYDIEFLYEICSKWLGNTINKENIDEITKAATYFIWGPRFVETNCKIPIQWQSSFSNNDSWSAPSQNNIELMCT